MKPVVEPGKFAELDRAARPRHQRPAHRVRVREAGLRGGIRVAEPVVPKGFGPPLGMYSHGMVARGGDLVIVAGQVGMTADGRVAGEDVVSQTRQALDNVRAVVEAAGCTMGDVVRLQTFLTRSEDIAGFMRARGEVFPSYFPDGDLSAEHAPGRRAGWSVPSSSWRSRRWRCGHGGRSPSVAPRPSAGARGARARTRRKRRTRLPPRSGKGAG